MVMEASALCQKDLQKKQPAVPLVTQKASSNAIPGNTTGPIAKANVKATSLCEPRAEHHSNPTIQYNGRVCDFHQRRKGDEEGRRVESIEETLRLFATPPPPEECPLCCHPMQEGAWDCDKGVSDQISCFRPCCGKNICCGCVFAVHHPEFKDPETFMRSVDPVFLKPKDGAGASTATTKSNKAKGGKTNKKKGKGKKKGGKSNSKGGKAQPADKSATASFCKAEPPSGSSPPPSSDEFVPVPDFGSPERTVQLKLDGHIKWQSQGTCPFCRTPELAGSDLVAALRKRINDQNCPEAHRAMGDIHYEGWNGLEKSLKKAREWWEKSAGLGSMLAHHALGQYHVRDEEDWKRLGYTEDMRGCKDPELARHHFTEAAIRGHPEARYNLAYYEAMDGQIRRAFAHYLLSARQGRLKALEQCKKVYEQGVILSQSDYELALKAHQNIRREMCTEQRVLAMRYRIVLVKGVARSDPLRSFMAGMYGRVFNNMGVMVNGKQEFRFNPDKGKYEEVTDERDFKCVGRFDADGRPLKNKR